MLHVLITGVLLGLASGLAPGPLQALVISQSAQFGWKRGTLVAFAPMITDAVIVAATVWLFSHVPAWVLYAMTVLGALMIGYIAWDTWRATKRQQIDSQSLPANAKGLWHAVMVNIVNPHAWLFWVVVGSPITVRYAHISFWYAVLFIISFYVLLVGIKVGLAVGIDRGLSFTGGKGKIWTLRITALALVILAIAMGITGIAELIPK